MLNQIISLDLKKHRAIIMKGTERLEKLRKIMDDK